MFGSLAKTIKEEVRRVEDEVEKRVFGNIGERAMRRWDCKPKPSRAPSEASRAPSEDSTAPSDVSTAPSEASTAPSKLPELQMRLLQLQVMLLSSK